MKAAILCNGINWTINKITPYIYIYIYTYIDLVTSETALQLQKCSLLVETVSNEIIDTTSLTEYFSVKRNVETLIRNFTSDIRARHRRKLLKFQNKPWIKYLKHAI